MRWNKPKKDVYRWRKFFAILPMRFNDTVVWLEFVERKIVRFWWDGAPQWTYRLPEKEKS